MDLNGLGCKVDDDSLFDLTFTVRSYEIGADGKASIQTIMSYFQEAITKILKRIGEIGDGSDSTYKNLTWVLTRIQVIVYRYPTWSDVVRVIKPCLTISGKHSLRWHMLICDCETSEVLVRATSNTAVMNRSTKKLSKISNETRAKLDELVVEKPHVIVKDTRILSNLDEAIADHICSGLMSVPESLLKNYELASMALTYLKECKKDCILQSFTSVLRSDNDGSNHVDCHHMLQLEEDGSVAVKGWT
ncbi:palmitoyl-acyl carrier protein thioesterase, chloroplastic-like, partial [Bidens hawaiensis]|uniref:palmitoyl-acyl carrier protein thioesterase, chloroplastic-like n=1 Tax=Bidens hawaiensis TaxID=980011 RepID=UPI00404AB99B